MDVVKGIPVSPGVVIGQAFILDEVQERVPYHTVREADLENELQRLELAISQARSDLEADRDRAAVDQRNEGIGEGATDAEDLDNDGPDDAGYDYAES